MLKNVLVCYTHCLDFKIDNNVANVSVCCTRCLCFKIDGKVEEYVGQDKQQCLKKCWSEEPIASAVPNAFASK